MANGNRRQSADAPHPRAGLPRTGMLMGAKVTAADWWLWNQIPVTLGNLVGGFTFTGLAPYATYKPASSAPPMIDPIAAKVPAE